MSLINDVLRDLERRGQTDAPRPLPRAERIPRRRGRWIWWVLAAAAVGAILHFSRGPLRQTADTEPVAATAPAPEEPAPAEPTPPLADIMPRAAIAAETRGSDGADGPGEDAPAVATEGTPERAGGDEPEEDGRPAGTTMASRDAPQDEDAPADRRTDGEPGNAGGRTESQSPSPASQAPAAVSGGAPRERQSGTTGESEIVIRRSAGTSESATGPDPLESAKRALGRGQRPLAISRLEQLLESRPGSVEARLLLARLHIEDGRPRMAADLLEAGLEGDRPQPSVAALYGRLLLDGGRAASARTVLGEHAPPVQSDPDYHLLLAMAHRRAGDPETAIEVYRRVTEVSPDAGAAWVGLGVSLENQGDTTGARAAYRKAVSGDDRRAAAFARQRLAVMPPSPETEEH